MTSRFWVACLVVGALAGAPSVLDACSLFCESPLETRGLSDTVSAGGHACHFGAPTGTAPHALSPKSHAHAYAYDGDIPVRVEGLRGGAAILASGPVTVQPSNHWCAPRVVSQALDPPAFTRPATLRI
mgnify:FL=1